MGYFARVYLCVTAIGLGIAIGISLFFGAKIGLNAFAGYAVGQVISSTIIEAWQIYKGRGHHD